MISIVSIISHVNYIGREKTSHVHNFDETEKFQTDPSSLENYRINLAVLVNPRRVQAPQKQQNERY